MLRVVPPLQGWGSFGAREPRALPWAGMLRPFGAGDLRAYPWATAFLTSILPVTAAVDRLVHHAVILEFDNESIRATEAKGKAAAKSAR